MNRMTVDGYSRITKKEAARRYNAGEVVRMTACKLSPVNFWGLYADAQKESYTQVGGDGFNTTVARNREFETVVNAFMYYNCQVIAKLAKLVRKLEPKQKQNCAQHDFNDENGYRAVLGALK